MTRSEVIAYFRTNLHEDPAALMAEARDAWPCHVNTDRVARLHHTNESVCLTIVQAGETRHIYLANETAVSFAQRILDMAVVPSPPVARASSVGPAAGADCAERDSYHLKHGNLDTEDGTINVEAGCDDERGDIWVSCADAIRFGESLIAEARKGLK